MFKTIEDRRKDGYLRKRLQLHKSILREFPDQVLEQKLYEIWKKRYFRIFRATDAVGILESMATDGFIEVCGRKFVVPKEEDVDTFLWEYPDLILPLYAENYDYNTISRFFDEGAYELNSNVCVCPGDIVIDCGANMGCFCSAVADRAETVYAFEPSDLICSTYLEKLKGIYGNIDIQNVALSNQSGVHEYCYLPESCASSFLADLPKGNVNENKSGYVHSFVQTLTLDDFVATKHPEHIDFIKVDIEGAERNLLRGAEKTLRTFAPKLSICTYHYDDDKKILEDIISSINPAYRIEHKYKKLYAYVEKRERK